MNKVLAVLVSLFVSKIMSSAKPASAFVLEIAIAQSRNMVMCLVAGLTFSFLLAGGVLLAVISGVNWFDGTSSTPNLFYAGLSITLLSTLFLRIVFSKKNWVISEEAKRIIAPKPEVAQVKSPIEEMIHLFISEYAKEIAKPSSGAAPHSSHPQGAKPTSPMSE